MSNFPPSPGGVVAGFKSYNTDTNNPQDESSSYSLTVDQIYTILRELNKKYDPESLQELMELIEVHLFDENNPHGVTIEQLVTDVIKELHKAWLAEGNDGDVDTFVKILFQDVKIADLDTTLAGESVSEVPSVHGVATVMNNHDSDSQAHAPLIRRMFPGKKTGEWPAMSLIAGANAGFEAIMTTPPPSDPSHWVYQGEGYDTNIYSHVSTRVGPSGFVTGGDPRKPLVDYTYGFPTFCLWGERSNLFYCSNTFTNTDYWEFEACTPMTSMEHISPCGDCCSTILIETTDNDPIVHRMGVATGNSGGTDQDSPMTISFFVKPMGRRYCAATFSDELIGCENTQVHFDLDLGLVYYPPELDRSRIEGEIVLLPSGWARCRVSYIPIGQWDHTRFSLVPLDIFDGDLSYQGDGREALGIWNFQWEDGIGMSPPITTQEEEIIVSPTTFRIRTSNWYNPVQGCFVADIVNHSTLTEPNSGRFIFDVSASGQQGITMYYPTNQNKVLTQITGDWNSFRGHHWYEVTGNDTDMYALSYSDQRLLAGQTGTLDKVSQNINAQANSIHNELFVGHDRFGTSSFNGYVKSIKFYPHFKDEDVLEFLLGEHDVE